jgi:hypothetical protein
MINYYINYAILQKTNTKEMVTRVNPIRRARRQMKNVQGRLLCSWAEERLEKNDDYVPFMKFCKEFNSAMTETSMVSEATFEFLQIEFEKKKRQEA